jgi:hypothetical protein
MGAAMAVVAAAVIMAAAIVVVVMATISAAGIMAAIFTAGRRITAHSLHIVRSPRIA